MGFYSSKLELAHGDRQFSKSPRIELRQEKSFPRVTQQG